MRVMHVGVLVALVLGVSGCDKAGVPPAVTQALPEYHNAKNIKVMAGAYQSARGGYAFEWVVDKDDLDEAIETAIRRCESSIRYSNIRGHCKVYFIGDQNVGLMSQAEKDRVAEEYKRRMAPHSPGAGAEIEYVTKK